MRKVPVEELKAYFPPHRIIADPVELLTYEIDAGLDRGRPDVVVLPESREEVVRAVQWATGWNLPIVARGAGTGLSGGAIAPRGGIIIEFSRMDRIRKMDARGRRAVVEPGVLNQVLDTAAAAHGLYYPPDPASGRASTLGGNVAENAGGPHCFKYGVTTNYITGMEVVLADGSVVRFGGEALDYPEYDLGGLVTGSEGTLAVVTEITVRLIRRPPGVKTLMAAFDTVEQAGKAVSAVVAAGLIPATLEMMDQNIMRIIEDYAHPGLPVKAGASLIVEVDGYAETLDEQIERVAAILREHGGFDLRIARNEAERTQIWLGRKSAAGAVSRLAPAYYLVDVTVPRSRLADMLATVNRICAERNLRVGYVFHAGDGNLHPLILLDPQDEEMVQRILEASKEIVQACVEMEGSITGEHGVGTEKQHYMPLMYTPEELSAMLDIKAVFDPQEVLNPGKVFPEEIPSPRLARPQGAIDAVVYPTSAQEAASLFAGLTASRRPARIVSDQPHVHSGEDVIISTARLRGILNFSPDDFTITVAAGTPLSEVQTFLAEHGMFLPLVAAEAQKSVGSIVATNFNAPLRLRYGGVRDLVLAMTVALPDGRLIRAGRPVVKNVAGYDLPKIFIGSWGTLGLIADVTFRVSPLPRARRTLAHLAPTLEAALAHARAAFEHALIASAVVVTPFDGANDGSKWRVLYTAEGHPREVEAELALVQEAWQGQGRAFEDTGNEAWAAFAAVGEEEWLVRVGLPPAALDEGVGRVREIVPQARALVDMGSGFCYLRWSGSEEDVGQTLSRLREEGRAMGGYAQVLHHPEGAKVGVFDVTERVADLMRKIKARWDPAHVLPGLGIP